MRSPSWARFPAAGIALSAALALSSCTSGEEAPKGVARPTGSAAPATSPASVDEPDGSEGNGGSASEGAATSVADRDSKRTVTGTAPRYLEIAEAGVAGSRDGLTLSMSLSGPIPERMPDEGSALRISFRLETKAGETFTFDAHCVRSGWSTFATGGPEEAAAPELTLHGESMELRVDPSYMGGIQPFGWIATATWSGADGDYAFDVAPRSGLASYP